MKIHKKIQEACAKKQASNSAAPTNLFAFSLEDLINLGYSQSKKELEDGDILSMDKTGTLFCIVDNVKLLRKDCSKETLAKLLYYRK